MAQLPITLHNVPITPMRNMTLTDVDAMYVAECFTTYETDPVTGRRNKVYALGYSERNMFPSYPRQHLSRPAAYGRTE